MGLVAVAFAFGLALTTVLGADVGCSSKVNSHVYQKSFGAKCYAFHKLSQSYRDAEKSCENLGGTLAQPKTEELNSFLAEGMVNSSLGNRAWIGLDDRASEGQYVWADGTKLGADGEGFSNFAENEGPRNNIVLGNLEDVVAIDRRGFWHDYRSVLKVGPVTISLKKLYFICELDID